MNWIFIYDLQAASEIVIDCLIGAKPLREPKLTYQANTFKNRVRQTFCIGLNARKRWKAIAER